MVAFCMTVRPWCDLLSGKVSARVGSVTPSTSRFASTSRLRPRVTVLSFGEGEDCGISLAGVVERPRRGWIHVGEIAGAKVKNGEVVPDRARGA